VGRRRGDAEDAVDSLTTEYWSALSDAERVERARRLSRELPTGFTFRGVRPFEMGGRHNAVAEFEALGASFVLIPGSEVTLGYDADREWEPTAEEAESWGDTAAEYGIDLPIRGWVASATLRPRRVCVGPLLMEATAHEPRGRPVSLDEPEVVEVVKGVLSEGFVARRHRDRAGRRQASCAARGKRRDRRGTSGRRVARPGRRRCGEGGVSAADVRRVGVRLRRRRGDLVPVGRPCSV
jgi:hypothetical protein